MEYIEMCCVIPNICGFSRYFLVTDFQVSPIWSENTFYMILVLWNLTFYGPVKSTLVNRPCILGRNVYSMFVGWIITQILISPSWLIVHIIYIFTNFLLLFFFNCWKMDIKIRAGTTVMLKWVRHLWYKM